ncbi:VOC family protein [Roseomonas sp. SSH11]|uniref:VOC family protein n=1 Tax=Pararoseomonas baculiformis TaxID=2820812 RepID=A0ABS4AGB6_9PROT|nr:VOC family protein [Pararoseomonas baculiformis]MBP0446062.1 VOC family protein [Pararoseomonas baculiformis]
MSEAAKMGNAHGEFIWYELVTSETGAASAFYGNVLGWAVRDGGAVPGYSIFATADAEVAGLMSIPPDAAAAGMPPQWLGYIAAEDVDATAAEVLRAGGGQHVPPTDIPGIGRFALLTDLQGVSFYVMRGAEEGESTAFAPMRPGHCSWNELSTTDQVAALDFYQARFGWEKGDAMPMGEQGEYRFINHRGVVLGAMMTRPPSGPRSRWTFYFAVEDIDTATERTRAGGGTVHYGPAEVPGGAFIIVASDPQGAAFGLVGPRKA